MDVAWIFFSLFYSMKHFPLEDLVQSEEEDIVGRTSLLFGKRLLWMAQQLIYRMLSSSLCHLLETEKYHRQLCFHLEPKLRTHPTARGQSRKVPIQIVKRETVKDASFSPTRATFWMFDSSSLWRKHYSTPRLRSSGTDRYVQ